MIERIRSWWDERSGRERGLLILLAVIALATLFWYGIAKPYDRLADKVQQGRDADARTLADVLLLANRIDHADRPQRNGQPIDALVRAEADRAGFTVAGVARDGEGAVLTMDAVRSEPYFAWIAAMKQRRGLIVTRLSARPNGDSTLSVSVRFERAR